MKLTDSLTILYLPFALPDSADARQLPAQSPYWETQDNVKIDTDCLYPYVANFMSGEVPNADKAVIYRLTNKAEKFVNKKIYVMTTKSGRKFRFKFCFEKNNLNTFHIIIYPHCPIGVLVVGVEPADKDWTTAHMTEFNYHIHKIDSQQLLLELENERAAESLFGVGKKGICLLDLCRMLLTDEVWSKITLLEPKRMHPFSYIRLSEKDNTQEEFDSLLVRLASVQTENYQTNTNKNSRVEMFRNICLCSHSEGGVMAVVTPDGDALPFIKEYKSNKFVAEYLWIYTFVVMQYYAMIHLTNRMYGNINAIDIDRNLASLWKIKKYMFVNISRHMHINQFYNTIIKNTGLTALYKTLDENYNYMQGLNREKIAKRTNWLLTFLTFSQVIFAIFSFFSVNVEWRPVAMILLGVSWSIACLFILLWFVLPITYISTRMFRRG
ncbi:MAG: hypothetical protein J1E02_05700 [Coprobacter sp.]|nr:hypothetical protein [Coprobacter sp.]